MENNSLLHIRHCEPPLLYYGGEAISFVYEIASGKKKIALAMTKFTRIKKLGGLQDLQVWLLLYAFFRRLDRPKFSE